MSKFAKPCSSCPAAPAPAAPAPAAAPRAENASPKKGSKIEFLLEDVLGQGSDGVIKVKQFKKFLGLDVRKLNIIGELQISIHKNGFKHVKMLVNYQDKTTNKVNYLELVFLVNKNKEENKNTVGVKEWNPNDCTFWCFAIGGFCVAPCGAFGVVANTTTENNEMSLKTTTKIKAGTDVKMKISPKGLFSVSFKP
jgi:hypothetical protein